MDEAFNKVQKKKKSSIPHQESHLFKIKEDDINKYMYFTVPSGVKDKLRREHTGHTFKKKFNFCDKGSLELGKSLENIDRHLRHGGKISSFSLMLSDVHVHVHVLAHSAEEQASIDPNILPVMFKLLDEFSSATSLRRSLVLDNLFWPSKSARERMEDLPLTGTSLKILC